MTALNIVVGVDAVHVVTDGAIYLAADQLAKAFGPKVATLPHLHAAVAVSGPGGLSHVIGGVIGSEAEDLDALVASPVVEILARTAGLGVPLRMFIAGISPTLGPAAWGAFDMQWRRIGPGSAFLAPHMPWAVPTETEGPGFEAAVIELAERQRAAFPVGGFLQLTTIRPDRIEQRILRRWPDRIGDVLGPKDQRRGI